MEPRVLLSFELVADVNTAPNGSGPTTFLTSGGVTYFTADDGVHGRELWRSDGTAAGTRMVKDIFPGPGGNVISRMVDVNGVVFFKASDGVHGNELWKSDGTEAGTVMVKDVVAGQNAPTMELMGAAGDKLLMRVSDAAHGSELWVSDGTEVGTGLLKDIRPGTQGSSIGFQWAAVPGQMFFFANDGAHGSELWASDGTEAGTRMIVDHGPGSQSSGPEPIHAIGNKVFAENGYATDGTAEGTVLVGVNSFNDRVLDVGGLAVWSDGNGLVYSDGTLAGTKGYFGIDSVRPGMRIRLLAGAGGLGYFWVSGSQTPGALELWRTDGTAAGTVPVVTPDVFAGAQNSTKHATIAGVGNELFFFVERSGVGTEFWRTDGTEAGTRLVQVVYPGNPGTSGEEALGRLGGVTLFVGDGPASGRELWKTDGTAEGTGLIKDVAPGTGDANPTAPVGVGAGERIVFGAAGPGVGNELWSADVSGGGLELLSDLRPGSGSSFPQGFVRYAGSVYFFAASDPAHGDLILHKSNGTAQGTTALKRVGVRDTSLVLEPRSVVMGGKLYFMLYDKGGAAFGLWTSDGTAEGTVLLKEFVLNTRAPEPFLSVIGSRLYFVGGDRADVELWASDGTAEGTVRVKDIQPGLLGSKPQHLQRFGDNLYFLADDGAHGVEVWRSDGTEAGTTIMVDLNPGMASSMPFSWELYAHRGALYFGADDGRGTLSLWRSDGTAAGTTWVANNPVFRFRSVGEQLFGIGGGEIWVTDGSTGGTRLVKDINGAASGSTFNNVPLTAFGGAVYFTASDGAHGMELWRSDGTAAGTVMVRDLVPGEGGFFHKPLGVAGDRLYVWADDGVSGVELWAVSDEVAPRVTSLERALDGRIRVRFSEDVGASLSAEDLTVRGSDGMERRPSTVSFDAESLTATWGFDVPLPNGDYVASLAEGAVVDGAGNGLAGAYAGAFFVLGGDANGDRKVDFGDLVVLAQNYGTPPGATAGTGDLNGDEAVNFGDLVVLAQNYGAVLPPPVAAAREAAGSAAVFDDVLEGKRPEGRAKVFATERVPAVKPAPPRRSVMPSGRR